MVIGVRAHVNGVAEQEYTSALWNSVVSPLVDTRSKPRTGAKCHQNIRTQLSPGK